MNKVELGKLHIGHTVNGQPIIGELSDDGKLLKNALGIAPAQPRTKEEAQAFAEMQKRGMVPLTLVPMFASLTLQKSNALEGVPEIMHFIPVNYPIDRLVTCIPVADLAIGHDMKNQYFEVFNAKPEPVIDVNDLEAADKAISEQRRVQEEIKSGSKMLHLPGGK